MTALMATGVVAQMVSPAFALLGQAKPPVLLCIVLYYALHREVDAMFIAGVAAGLLQDALSPVPLGYSSVCFCLLGWITSRFRTLVMTENHLTSALFGAAGGAAGTFLLYLLLLREHTFACSFWRAVWRSTGTGLLGAVAAPVILSVSAVLDRAVGNTRVRRGIHGFG